MNTRTADGFGNYVEDREDRQSAAKERRFSIEAITQSLRNVAGFSEVLRILGASVLVASMSVFLLQGWSDGNDISRYLMLLTQTGLLAGAGFAMSHGIRETKGARMFFGLALISVPANFTILGALLYSLFQWDGGLTDYPGYARWEIVDAANIGITLGGAMLVLVPVTLLCFAIMARRSMKPLSLHFLLLNALLLLPVRSSIIAGVIAMFGVAWAMFAIGRQPKDDPSLRTGEGRFALATLFIPLGIILFRSLYFYDVDSLMVAMVSMTAFIALRQLGGMREYGSRLTLFLESLSLPIAALSAVAIADTMGPLLGKSLAAPFFSVIFTAFAVDLILRTANDRFRSLVIGLTSVIAMLCFSMAVAMHSDPIATLAGIVAGALMLLAGVVLNRRDVSFCALATVVLSVTFGISELWEMVLHSSWIDLAVFGTCAIVLGSVLDRYGLVIRMRTVNWFEAIGERRSRVAVEEEL